jgi:hypothetical protein
MSVNMKEVRSCWLTCSLRHFSCVVALNYFATVINTFFLLISLPDLMFTEKRLDFEISVG